MNLQHEAIFRKAMASGRPQAILEVACAFHNLGDTRKARILHERARTMTWVAGVNCNIGFGAMARGTAIPNTNGAVIPPGRYWQDIIGAPGRKAWDEWVKSKPEVHVETTEDHVDDNRLFVIFSVPANASNYGMTGVFFPTKVLGFPTIADATISSSQDTIQRPPPMSTTDVLAKMAETAGKTAGAAAKGAGEGLGVSPTTLALIGAGALLGLLVLSKIMIPIHV